LRPIRPPVGAFERRQPSVLVDGSILITGEVERTTRFERGMPPAHQAWDGRDWHHDAEVIDDQALVVHVRGQGLIALSGCGHAGIVNIVRPGGGPGPGPGPGPVACCVMTAYSAADWTGFAATAATAAATLAGLLFIAVSINLQRILQYPNLPGRAAETLIFFAFPLIVTLLVIVPGQPRPVLAWELVAAGLLIGAAALLIDLKSGQSSEESRAGRLATRITPILVSFGGVTVAGITLLAGGGGGLYWLVPGVLGALIGGLGNTWVLLVEILR
jgi:hypothetical protein